MNKEKKYRELIKQIEAFTKSKDYNSITKLREEMFWINDKIDCIDVAELQREINDLDFFNVAGMQIWIMDKAIMIIDKIILDEDDMPKLKEKRLERLREIYVDEIDKISKVVK